MDKLLFKKAMTFVDALRVKIGLNITSSMIALVYSLIAASTKEDGIFSGFVTALNFFLNEKLEKVIDVTTDTLDSFDALFNSGFHHTEVYLGRDGVYAYLARRAQLWVRRKAGLRVPRIIYLVYNSIMRDSLTKEEAIPYLAQFGLTPDNHDGVLYYDTGLSGSIPIKIMEHLGVQYDNSLKKYKMVSFSNDANDDRNIALPIVNKKYRDSYWTESCMRDEFCLLLEYLSKSEDTATGICTNPNGRITHVAVRFTGDTLRIFKVIRKILVQYFYTREKNALNNNTEGYFVKSPFPTTKVDIVVSKHCKLCDNHYHPEQEFEHENKCYDCYSTYCGDDHQVTCNLCGEYHCVNSGSHNDVCAYCGITYCHGEHYTLYCWQHEKYYCTSDWIPEGDCGCAVNIDTSLAAVFAYDWATISKAFKVI
jgi:hypothetical protein